MMKNSVRSLKHPGKKVWYLLAIFVMLSVFSFNLQAQLRVLYTGIAAGNQAADQVFANGELLGSIDRPDWISYRDLTTEDIINNYDVIIVGAGTNTTLYNINWTTRIYPFLASGGHVIWEEPILAHTETGLVTIGDDHILPNVDYNNLNVLNVPGLTDNVSGQFDGAAGWFSAWNPALSPFLNTTDPVSGLMTFGVYGEVGAGRIVISGTQEDYIGSATGSPAQQNQYQLLINKLSWVAAGTGVPDANLRIIPDVSGLSEAAATAAINNANLTVGGVYYSTTNVDVSGNVIQQTPPAGEAGFVGDAVTLIVVATQTGSPVTVPNVKNVMTSDAETSLAAVGLNRGSLTFGPHPSVPAGAVIAQNPVSGTTSTTGWIVDLIQSTGAVAGKVPSLKWLESNVAQDAIVASGYNVGLVGYESHSVLPAGTVIDQYPWSGAGLALGATVDIVVSSGIAPLQLVVVPNVVGLSQAVAGSTMTNAGLKLGNVSQVASETIASGVVISQTPGADSSVNTSSSVNLVVSAGAAISVPDLVGLSETLATNAIINAGLSVGIISRVANSSVPAGEVLSQTPSAGQVVGSATAVDLVISNGVALVSVPGVVGWSRSEAEASIIGSGLNVGNVRYVCSRSVSSGFVVSQTPGANNQVVLGADVDLDISRGYSRRSCR